jgi:hypothetical protein
LSKVRAPWTKRLANLVVKHIERNDARQRRKLASPAAALARERLRLAVAEIAEVLGPEAVKEELAKHLKELAGGRPAHRPSGTTARQHFIRTLILAEGSSAGTERASNARIVCCLMELHGSEASKPAALRAVQAERKALSQGARTHMHDTTHILRQLGAKPPPEPADCARAFLEGIGSDEREKNAIRLLLAPPSGKQE